MMNINILIAIVMVSSLLFIAGTLASPLKSILLPVNIPISFEFESVHSINPEMAQSNMQLNPYKVVVLARDGSQMLRMNPEEARDALKIVASNLNGNAKLVWGESDNLNFYSEPSDTFKPFKTELAGPFVSNPAKPTSFEILGNDPGFQALINAKQSESINVEEFKWALAGKSIPLAGGEAHTGSWMLTSDSRTPVQTMISEDDQRVTIKYVSLFTSPNVYAEDLVTGQIMPIPFETTVTGYITPAPSELPSYINSQIYLQAFGWMGPIGALMTIIWVDSRYRQRIRKMLKQEVRTE